MENIARALVKHPGIVAATLGVVTVLFALYLPGTELRTDTASLAPKDDPVIKELEETIQDFGSQEILMVAVKGNVFTPEKLAKVRRLADRISRVAGVEKVLTPLDVDVIRGDEFGIQISPVIDRVPTTRDEVAAFREALAESRQGSALVTDDGEAMAILITLEPDIVATTRAQTLAGEVEALARQEEGPDDEIYIVGEAYMGYCASQNMRRDLRILLPLALLVVIGALYLSFGSAFDVAALIAGIVMSLVWTVGLMNALGYDITIVSMILPIILVSMGSAAGIHILNRFHEEVRSSRSTADAVVKVVLELTSPISMTSLTTAVGFASFVTSFIPPVREFGAFAAAGIMLNMVISLTWIPAILVIRGKRHGEKAVSAGTDAGTSTSMNARDLRVGIPPLRDRSLLRLLLDASGRYTASHPWAVIGAAIVVTLVFALGIPGLAVETNIKQYFRQDSPVVRGTRLVEEYFGGTLRLSVLVDTGEENGIKSPAVLRKMVELEDKMGSVDNVSGLNSVAGLVRQINRALNSNDQDYYVIPDTPEAVAQELLLFTMQGGSGLDSMVSYDFRKALVSARVTNVPTPALGDTIATVEGLASKVFEGTGIRTAVVGMPKVMVRLVNRFMDSQIRSLAFSMVGVWVVVSLIMGSPLLGLLCLIALCISTVVNFGFMSFAGIPLDVVTIMISGICIGVGVDYSIHLLSRYCIELRGGRKKSDALACAIGSTGRGVFFNAATLVLGFGLLVFSGFRAISVFGILVAATMFTSALGALVVLPAVLSLVSADLVARAGLQGRRKGTGAVEAGQEPSQPA
ncbi:MAG: MMPL family transporter [Bacillota bacterium]